MTYHTDDLARASRLSHPGRRMRMTRKGTKLRVAGGQVFISESIAKGSGKGAEARERNVTVTLLESFKAVGKITDLEYEAGKKYIGWHELMQKSGADSTQRISVCGSRSGWSDAQCDTEAKLRLVDAGLSRDNWLILRAFCDGWSVRESIKRSGVPWHPNGIMARFREVLRDLIRAMST